MKIIYRKLGREKAFGQAYCGENTIERQHYKRQTEAGDHYS